MKTLMNAMKVLALMSVAAMPVMAQSNQSTLEKAKATGNDVKREVKKAGDRTEEALCMGTKAECAAKKVKNRTTEAKDAVVDGAKEVKDKVDSDGK